MARTLSDTIIMSMIEAATRLAGGRGPISGMGGSGGPGAHGGTDSHAQTGAGAAGAATADTTAASSGSGEGAQAGSSGGSGRSGQDEHDTRSAEQIGSDFKTIYRHIEEVVKSSAEQETKAVGFAPASR